MTAHTLPNLGYVKRLLTPEQLAPVWQEIHSIQNDPTNKESWTHNLVGNIRREYRLTESEPHLETIALDLCSEYVKNYSYPANLEQVEGAHRLAQTWTWANFMRAGEYNPAHGHNGVMSWVLWLQVPYLLADEDREWPTVSEDKRSVARFALHYTDAIGTINTQFIPVDRCYEGVMIMFPSAMRHSVFPFFTSQQDRISVAGNLLFKPESP
jgi:hypothetical protein